MTSISLKIIRGIADIKGLKERIRSAAGYYAKQDMYILPLRPGTKWLDKKGGINYQSASKNPKIIDKWFGPDGRYEGWNIGIACGREGGVFAVDIDVHGGDGFRTLERLEKEHGKIVAPMQKTPSGGRHYLFKWREGARSSTDIFGEDGVKSGIDTRGGTIDASKGHIVVWPSVVEDEDGNDAFYEWETGGLVKDAPGYIIEKLGIAWTPRAAVGTGRGNEEVGEDDQERSYSIKQIGNMLEHIDIEDISYDDWLYIGQAINSQHPDSKGIELWDRWSQHGSRYESNECAGRWNAFDPNGPIRIATLIAVAQRYGYDPKTHGRDIVQVASDEPKGDFASIVDEYNSQFAVVLMGASVKVMKENPPNPNNMMADRYVLMDRNGFRMLQENDNIVVADAKGNPKLMSKSDIWLAEESRRTYTNGMLFSPGMPPEFDDTFNMWRGWELKAEEGEWDAFKAHIKDNICSGNEDHFIWILDWMADIIQDPMNPKGTCLVFHGIEGCGKGTFAHMFGKLFGRHYKHVTNEEHFVGRFNGHLQDSIFTFADEITYGGSKKTAGLLKAMVTEPYLMTERKGVDATPNPNRARMVISSNEDWFIPAGPQSRRWFILDIGGAQANNEKYFKAIRDQMNEGGYEAMFYELQHRKITANLRHAPETKALEKQRTRSMMSDSITEWWLYCVINEDLDVPSEEEWEPGKEGEKTWPERVKRQPMFEAYKTWAKDMGAKVLTQGIFNDKMEEFGLEAVKARQGSTRINVFNIPNLHQCSKVLEFKTGAKIE